MRKSTILGFIGAFQNIVDACHHPDPVIASKARSDYALFLPVAELIATAVEGGMTVENDDVSPADLRTDEIKSRGIPGSRFDAIVIPTTATNNDEDIRPQTVDNTSASNMHEMLMTNTVAVLREMALSEGIALKSEWNKSEIVAAIVAARSSKE